MEENKVYICNDHDLHWPVGGGSVVVAPNVVEARKLLDVELVKWGLKPYKDEKYHLVHVSMSVPSAYIISDGDY